MDFNQILAQWRNHHFDSIYWLEGGESYYIDRLVGYAEKNILSIDEVSFNLTVFYGKDAKMDEGKRLV